MAFYMEFVGVCVFVFLGMVYGFCLLARRIIGRMDQIEINGIYVYEFTDGISCVVLIWV